MLCRQGCSVLFVFTLFFFFFQAEDGIRDYKVTGVQTCALPIRENNIGGNYFAVMGTRLVAGRAIDFNDRDGTQPVSVVSRNFATHFLAGREPLGQWIKVNSTLRQVVGIAEDGPSNDLHELPSPYLYLPYTQVPLDDVTLMVETAGE